MPQLNPDEAATDEPTTYKDEAIGGDDSNDLSDIKGDLVDEDDGDPIRQSYENKNSGLKNGRSKHGFNGDGPNENPSGRPHFPYSQHDVDSFVSGFGHSMLQNAFLPTSAQVPYSHYMNPYMGSLLCRPSPPMDHDKSQVPGLPRIPYSDVPAMLPLPGQLGQIPHPLSPWSPSPLHPLCTSAVAAGMLRYPYPFHNFSSSSGMGSISPFPLIPHPPGNGIRANMMHHPPNLPGAPQLNGHHDYEKSSVEKKNSNSKRTKKSEKLNRPYVKKPLNAFMIYMKEQRAKVVAECTLKESAAINQILGRKWHSLDREEQQKYYEIARKERQLHMQLHPSWSARDNYGKRKKRKKEKPQDCSGQNAKKCRAVFGLDQQNSWCAPCRRKKKCIRYHHEGEDSDDSDESRNEDGANKISSLVRSQSQSCENPAPRISQSSFSSNDSVQPLGDSVAISLPSSQSDFSIQVKQEKSPLQCKSDQRQHQQGMIASGCPTTPVINSQSGSTRIVNGTPPQHAPGPPTGQFVDNLRAIANSLPPPNPPLSADTMPLRMSSNSDASLASNGSGGSRSTLFSSPLLSPSTSSISSPHSNPPLISYFAAAAGLPASSPLGSFMGFPNLHGLASPIHMGLNGSSSPVSHVTSNGPRLTSSALEGKS